MRRRSRAFTTTVVVVGLIDARDSFFNHPLSTLYGYERQTPLDSILFRGISLTALTLGISTDCTHKSVVQPLTTFI